MQNYNKTKYNRKTDCLSTIPLKREVQCIERTLTSVNIHYNYIFIYIKICQSNSFGYSNKISLEQTLERIRHLICLQGQLPASWPRAKVVKVYPSKDGRVRTVQIRTGFPHIKLYDRPITKLCPLPEAVYGVQQVNNEQEDQIDDDKWWTKIIA